MGALLLVVSPGFLWSCGDDGEPEFSIVEEAEDEEHKIEFACTLGTLDEEGAFRDADDGAPLEIQWGFQGFLFVGVSIVASGDVPSVVSANTRVDLPQQDPTGAIEPEVMIHAVLDEFLSEPILLFFNSSTPSELEDLDAEVSIRLESETHTCTTVGRFHLVDEDPCIHTDAVPICPGDSGQGGQGGQGVQP